VRASGGTEYDGLGDGDGVQLADGLAADEFDAEGDDEEVADPP